MSLCFLEAFEAKKEGRITEEEYIKYLTAHLRGVRHDADRINEYRWADKLYGKDSFGALFRGFALSTPTLSIKETTLYDQLLQQCLNGDLEALEFTFAKFASNPSLLLPFDALAVVAVGTERPDILGFLLENGAALNDEVSLAASGVSTIEMLEFLWDKNWDHIQHAKRKQQYLTLSLMHKPVAMLEFLSRKGARFSHDAFNCPDSGKMSLAAMRLFVEDCGAHSLKKKAVVTLAAEQGNWDVVEYFCKLGVAVNDIPPEFDKREPYADCTPLYAAVKRRDIKMVELLLKHGADPNALYRHYSSQSLLEQVREQHSDDTEMLALLEKYAPAKPPSQNPPGDKQKKSRRRKKRPLNAAYERYNT